MSNTDSPEAKELRLVGNVELRLAMITTDGAMEKALNTYLVPLLLKLASEFVSVRNKVISVCQHVNTRIKPPYVAPIPGSSSCLGIVTSDLLL